MTTRPHRLPLLLPPDLLAEIEERRRTYPDLPSRTETIRRLIRVGLGADSRSAEPEPPAQTVFHVSVPPRAKGNK
jgi:hypothetical protein